MTLEATRDILGAPTQDRDFILAIAKNLGWTHMELDGIGKPDLMLMRGRIIPIFIRSKPMGAAKRRAWSQLSLAGSVPRCWGRFDGPEIMEELAK